MGLFDYCKPLEKALGVASLRQQVIANNIANANTAGFRATNVAFEDSMRKALAVKKHEEGEFELTGLVDPEFDLGSSGNVDDVQPTMIKEQGAGVDMNKEMANLAKNQIVYQALTRKISGNIGALKYVIDNSGR
jgi:flagellar basal-body rod protein FlgB